MPQDSNTTKSINRINIRLEDLRRNAELLKQTTQVRVLNEVNRQIAELEEELRDLRQNQ